MTFSYYICRQESHIKKRLVKYEKLALEKCNVLKCINEEQRHLNSTPEEDI